MQLLYELIPEINRFLQPFQLEKYDSFVLQNK